MSVSVIYSAIPPTSTLYARLQREKAFSILLVEIFPYGCGVFRFLELPPEEIDEILAHTVKKYQESFGSKVEASQIIAAFLSELRYTRQAYPGIEDRRTLLENSPTFIEKRLLQELSRRQGANATELVQKLMFGDRTLAPTLLSANKSLGLISRELVSEGANVLQQINHETLLARYEDWEERCLEDLRYWRDLYLLAAEKDEEILVGVF